VTTDATDTLQNPILNTPFDPPSRYFELGPKGPTGVIHDGRRRSESFIPVPTSRKKSAAGEQEKLDFDATGERIEENDLINEIRFQVDRWRLNGYPRVTPYTKKLLEYWSADPPTRDDKVFFCQREAAETAIYLTEVAGRGGITDFRERLDEANRIHNDDLPRVGLKMATGTGKTVVMAMLIAWQTINKVHSPRDNRFAKQFLVVTPGITIRDRLQVLQPSFSGNYYRERDLVPADLWEALLKAEIVITNYHGFLHRDSKEIKGVSANTRKLLLAERGDQPDPFQETDDQMVARLLRDFSGRGKGEIVVLSDEAHHCYQDKVLEDPDEVDSEAEERNADARVWFKGLQAVRENVGIKTIYDLSATPYYLKGSGYNEGFIFSWVVSDFSLMDAIESGIVKVPRIPVDDDAKGEQLSYLRLWDLVGSRLPKRNSKTLPVDGTWPPPQELQGAAESLYRSYERAFRHYEDELADLGEPPPVMIVVCPNTVVSKLMYLWISGSDVEGPDGEERTRAGALPLLSNVENGRWLERPRTVLIDSKQLESGEAFKDDFKNAAKSEIEAFKAEYRRRYPGADVDKLTDEDLLREVMNTVGKTGRLGGRIRCVVSVSMLTEGWDANTVTHVLGIRAFGSQLLCEQVVGRGLRRRSYAVNEESKLEPEYAEIYGVPFAFIPSDRSVTNPQPKPPAVYVRALDERGSLRISFPKLDGYRLEIPDSLRYAAFTDDAAQLHVTRDMIATWTKTGGIVGGTDEQTLESVVGARGQQVAFAIAKTILEHHMIDHPDDRKPWLFPQLVQIAKEWMDSDYLTFEDDAALGLLLLSEGTHKAAEVVTRGVNWVEGSSPQLIQPILRRFDPDGSTEDVHFPTRKPVVRAEKSHVSHVVLDGPMGNTWEEAVAELLEKDDRVAAYVKNDHLGFLIPYVYKGRSHEYEPDFLALLAKAEDDELDRTLIIEVSGGLKKLDDPDLVKAKANTARHQWCPAVNNHGGWGRWGYVEIDDMASAKQVLDGAIESLRKDGVVTGLPEQY